MTMTLIDALAISDFTSRRAALRKLAQAELDRQGWSSSTVRRMFHASPSVGEGSNQIDPRPTISGFVSTLDEATLIYIAAGKDIAAVKDAVTKPAEHGMVTSATKTGVLFGRPVTLNEAAINALVADIKSSTPTESTMTENTYGLTEAATIYDSLRLSHGDDAHDDILDAMAMSLDATLMTGLRTMLSVREGKPEHVELTASLAEVVDACNRALVAEPEAKADVPAYSMPDAAKAQLIDLTLAQAGLPAISKLLDELNSATKRIADAEAAAKVAVTASVAGAVEKASGEIPKGRVVVKSAWEAFGLSRAKDTFSFDVPVWEWEGDHPHVPEVDEGYVFRPFELLRVLYAIITNQRCYLHGHTGTGKTTLIEQVAARLNWPFMRVNFDSEITRMDLIGRDVLTNEGGVTTSKFVDGVLPQMMSGPYIGCFDEIDFVRPDVGYVMQRALEGNGLLLTEDGGRMVKPHRLFRMFATGNTVGQGDEFGMYQGARPQSLALLDRFTVWIHVDYMSASDRRKLLTARVPSLDSSMMTKIDQYIGEHLEAFKGAKVLQPISPRSYLALAQATVTFTSFFPKGREAKAFEQAFEATILDRSSAQDRAVLKGIADRIFN